ncbi:MAG: DUF2461 domain-containing protein [Acidobacteriota bacterium]
MPKTPSRSSAPVPAAARRTSAVAPRFTSDTLRFLRALKRNNDREWFRARRDEYDRVVRTPMIAVIERLAVDLARVAPEIIASPKTSLYRIYRDTRFSEDKSPLKTHISASFRWRGLPKGGGAGLYLEVHPAWVWMGGGFYAPDSPHLVRIREHLSTTYPEIHRIVRAPGFRREVGSLEGEKLTRLPRGFANEDPASVYLKYKQYLAGQEFPAGFAADAGFYPALLRTFKAILPLVRFLNEPLEDQATFTPSSRR